MPNVLLMSIIETIVLIFAPFLSVILIIAFFSEKIRKRKLKNTQTQDISNQKYMYTEIDENILTDEQIELANTWYDKHRNHVNKIIDETEHIFPPSQREDLVDPRIWKPAHWRWFLGLYH